MANTDIMEEQLHLPPTMREILTRNDRTIAEDDSFFVKIAPKENRVAIMNNYEAYKFARGYEAGVHHKLLNSKVIATIHRKLVAKICTNVSIDGETDEGVNELNRRTRNLFKSINQQFSYSLGRGEACYTIDKLEEQDKETIAYVNVYPLERYRIVRDAYDNIIDIVLYKSLFDGTYNGGVYSKYLLAEHRFKANDGKYYLEYIVTMFTARNEKFTDIKEQQIEDIDVLPPTIKEKLDDVRICVRQQIPCLGAYVVKNTLVNELCPNADVGESQYLNAIEDCIATDTTMTYREIDKNIGRGRVMTPSLRVARAEAISLSNNRAGRIEYASQRGTILDSVFMQQYDATSTGDNKNPINPVQFNLRTAEWIADEDNYIGKICTKCGLSVFDYNPTLFGGQRTAREVDALGDITKATVEEKRSLAQDTINEMLNDLAMMLGINCSPFVKWDKSTIENKVANLEMVIQKLNNHLISKKTALKELYPNWNDDEIDAELDRINGDYDENDPFDVMQVE